MTSAALLDQLTWSFYALLLGVLLGTAVRLAIGDRR